jgi:hypothetical protein
MIKDTTYLSVCSKVAYSVAKAEIKWVKYVLLCSMKFYSLMTVTQHQTRIILCEISVKKVKVSTLPEEMLIKGWDQNVFVN